MPKINTSGQPSYEGHEGVVTNAVGENFSVGREKIEDAPFEPTLHEPEETQEETREHEETEKEESSPGSNSLRSASSSAKTQQQSKSRR